MKSLLRRVGLYVGLYIFMIAYTNYQASASAIGASFRAADTLFANSVDGSSDTLQQGARRGDSPAKELNANGATKLPAGVRWRNFCDSLQQGWVALAAVLLPGSGQVINRDYWKIPIFYGGIAGFSYGVYHFDKQLKALEQIKKPDEPLEVLLHEERLIKTGMMRNGMIAGACITYAASVADALISHSPTRQSPTAAMVSSALLPGLGQMYNRSFWKLPIIYGSLGYLISAAVSNHQLFLRYERAYVAIADNDPATIDEFDGKIPVQRLEYGMNFYQRYRDLAIIGAVLVYVLNIIDAYVDAHLFYWNVDDDVEVRADPQLAMLNPRDGLGIVPAMRLSIAF